MGLMIVVILVIVGVLFAVKFVVLKKPTEVRQTFSRTQMASNFGLALMSSTTQDCRGTAIKNLLIDCAEWPEAGGTITCDDGRRSCEYINTTIPKLLDDTLTKWNQKYYLMAGTSKWPDEQIVYHYNLGCTAKEKLPGESESFFLPTSRGLLTLKIFICQ
jgi:hypothetical protein